MNSTIKIMADKVFSCEEAALEGQMSVCVFDPKTEYYQG